MPGIPLHWPWSGPRLDAVLALKNHIPAGARVVVSGPVTRASIVELAVRVGPDGWVAVVEPDVDRLEELGRLARRGGVQERVHLCESAQDLRNLEAPDDERLALVAVGPRGDLDAAVASLGVLVVHVLKTREWHGVRFLVLAARQGD